MKCMTSIIPKHGCGLLDLDCICTSEPLTVDMIVCLAGNCTIKEQLRKFEDPSPSPIIIIIIISQTRPSGKSSESI